jgi:predicted nucleic acid-binding protein
MCAYLLDTLVLIDAINRKRSRWELLPALVAAGDTLAYCAISATEIYAGMRPHEAEATPEFLEALEIFDIDWRLARYAGLLKNEWAKQGRTLSVPDVSITATALLNRLGLMTDNRKDLPMPQLAFYPLP